MTDEAKDQAVHWALRQRAGDMDEAEWDAFTDWLEADPEHAALLDEVEAADDALGEIACGDAPEIGEPQPAANDNQLKRLIPLAGLVAAALAVFAIWPSAAPDPVFITTQPGETRQIALSDEITMKVNGSSEVSYIAQETSVSIVSGEVAFEIDSDEPSPLRVTAGDLVLTDYGTVFNVVLSSESVSVAVAEGIVGINPDSANIEVNAGEQIVQNRASGELVRSEVDSETVGTWAEGRLEFDNTPALEAVAMLERSIGSKVTLAEALQEERLTGSLILAESERETVSQFAAFLDARARRGRLAGYGMVWDVR